MKYRKPKGVTEHYSSFEELRMAKGIKPISKKRTKDLDKLNTQRTTFCNHYKCKGCGMPLEYIGSGIMTCKNEKCAGIKNERINKDGTTSIFYEVSYELLGDKFREIADNLFD